MSDAAPTPNDQPVPADTSRLSIKRLGTLGGFGVLAVLVLILFWKVNNPSPVIQTENVELKKQLLNMEETLNEFKEVTNLRRQSEQVRRSDLQQAVGTAEEASRAIDEFHKAVTAWQRSTTELLTTDKGKSLAANAEAVRLFYALRNQHRPDAASPEVLRSRLETLKEPLTAAIATKDVNYSTSTDLVSRIEAIKTEARAGAEVYAAHNRNLASIVASVPGGPSDGPTLETALQRYEEQMGAEEARTVSEVIERERKDRAEKLAVAKAETERELTAAQLKAEETQRAIKLREVADNERAAKAKAAEDEQARAMALKDAEQARIAAQKEAELERKFQAALPEIKSLLMPFISEGFTQPVGREYQRTLTKKRVSYNALKSSGQLTATPDGVREFVASVNYSNSKNDRPLGSFPNTWSHFYEEPWFEPGHRAQALLIEFGDLLVKKKMLEE